jgi:hypothetical protein
VAQKLPPRREKEKLQTVSQALAAQPYVAWEYRHRMGRFYALSLTWQRSLFFPLRFFRGVPLVGGYRSPLTYGILWALVGIAGGIVWKLLFFWYPDLLELVHGHPIAVTLQLSRTYAYIAAALVLSPLIAMALLLGSAILYHIFISLSTRQHAGFEGTLRVVCYSTGTNIFFFLPILGGIIGAIWQLVLILIGLKQVHRLSFVKTVAVALLPYLILLGGALTFMLWSVTKGFLHLDPSIVREAISLLLQGLSSE